MENLQIKINVEVDEAIQSIREVEKALAKLEYRIDKVKKRLLLFRLISKIKKLFKRK